MNKDIWVSTCCSALPLTETDGDKDEPLGMCSDCKDHAVFYLQCYYCAQDARGCGCAKSAHDDDLFHAMREGEWPRSNEPVY